MRYGSVCSGIGSCALAFSQLGWECSFFSEISNFPSEVLNHHFPNVQNIGDFTQYEFKKEETVDLLVGGTPCQSFSTAGKRQGLDDSRGNLSIEFIKLANKLGARWVLWENVPGVLSSNKGRDFGVFLSTLVECGYSVTYRVLDAQYFGVPQRRRRVFVVGYRGDWRPPVAVLFERKSCEGDIAPSREAREIASHKAAQGSDNSFYGGGSGREISVATTLTTKSRLDYDTETFVVKEARGVSENQRSEVRLTDKASSLTKGGGKPEQGYAVIYTEQDKINVWTSSRSGDIFFYRNDISGTLTRVGHKSQQNMLYHVKKDSYSDHTIACVRRLTPRECERLQGLPDDWTRIPWRGKNIDNCPDTPRYHAIGNGFAVPVVRWIGKRISQVEEIINQSKEDTETIKNKDQENE